MVKHKKKALHVTLDSIVSWLKKSQHGVGVLSLVGVRQLQFYLWTHVSFDKRRKALPLVFKIANRSLIRRAPKR